MIAKGEVTMKKFLGTALVLFLVSGAFGMDVKIFGGLDWAHYQRPQGYAFIEQY